MSKFRRYRETVAAEGVKPLSYVEWKLGRIAGKLEVAVATMAQKRGRQRLPQPRDALRLGRQPIPRRRAPGLLNVAA